MPSFIAAFPESELENNASRAIELGGKKVLVCRAGGELYAVENRCSTKKQSLLAVESAVASSRARYMASDLI